MPYKRPPTAPRRHPADVTADRLTDHYETYYAYMDGRERDDLSRTIQVLREIAEGNRTATEGWNTR